MHVFNDFNNDLTVVSVLADDSVYRVYNKNDGDLVCELHMQVGPVATSGINGLSLEVLVAIATNRLQNLNKKPNNTAINRQCLNHLSSALLMLDSRKILQQSDNGEDNENE